MRKNSLATKQKSCNLKFSTMQKMIRRLLTQDRIKTELDEGSVINHYESKNKPMVRVKAYTKAELVRKLNISLEEFEKLKSPGSYRSMIDKISLSLIRLYCATKFVDDEHIGNKL